MATFLDAEEERCLRIAAKWPAVHQYSIDSAIAARDFGLDAMRTSAMLRRLESIGAVVLGDNTQVGSPCPTYFITPAPECIDLVRDLDRCKAEEAKPKDLVSHIQNWSRSRPWLAWPIIIIAVTGALLTIANQVWEFVAKIIAHFSKGVH